MGSRGMRDDDEVIRRVLDGDLEAFRVLVKRYEGALFCLLRNLTGRLDECEDVAQETFLAAYRNLAAYDARRAPSRRGS